MISTTRIAMLHNELPRVLKFVNDSCPGVSIISKPGTLNSKLSSYIAPHQHPPRSPQSENEHTLFRTAVFVLIASTGKYVAPICCVIPPASPS